MAGNKQMIVKLYVHKYFGFLCVKIKGSFFYCDELLFLKRIQETIVDSRNCWQLIDEWKEDDFLCR
jgi:hypothetical protein